MPVRQSNTGTNEELTLDAVLDKLKRIIETEVKAKQQPKVIKWLDKFADYLLNEDKFDPKKDTIKYEAGTIVSVNFGYNPGSEHGGGHFAVVVEDNAKSSPVVMVVPLGSCAPGNKVHRNDVDLGVIDAINALSHYPSDTRTIATISQMRAISKMRIVAPVNNKQQRIILGPDQLRPIYDRITERFASKGLGRDPGIKVIQPRTTK